MNKELEKNPLELILEMMQKDNNHEDDVPAESN